MSQILSYLYLGGKSDAKDKAKLQKLNVKYILNCTPPRSVDSEAGCPNFYEKEKSFVYKRIPIFDNKGEDLVAHMNAAYSFIEEGKHYGNVLVHCHKGVSRSASFVIGYLMRKNEFTLEEALSHVQMCRAVVSPNSSFITQLERFQLICLANIETIQESNDTSKTVGAISIGPAMPHEKNKVPVNVEGPSGPPEERPMSPDDEMPCLSPAAIPVVVAVAENVLGSENKDEGLDIDKHSPAKRRKM